jgi:hypothetical protein
MLFSRDFLARWIIAEEHADQQANEHNLSSVCSYSEREPMKEIAKHFVRWGSILLALGMLVHWHFAIFVGASI